MKINTLLSKLNIWSPKGLFNMSNAPIVILDTANLLAGEKINFEEAKQIIHVQLIKGKLHVIAPEGMQTCARGGPLRAPSTAVA